MAKYQRIVTTKAGLELLESVTLGGTIQFTSLKTGTGTYDGTEDLAAMTSIKSVRQTFGIGSVTKETSDILVRTILCNNDVTVGYAITELGLYTKNPITGAEVLFAITVAASGCEDYMPVYAEEPTSIVVDFVIGITDAEKVTFAVAPMKDTYVQLTTFNEFVAKTNDEIALERARIDTFTSLPDGATQNDAALADICVGFNGTTYASPGIAVRTQFANVNNEVTGVKSDLSKVETELTNDLSELAEGVSDKVEARVTKNITSEIAYSVGYVSNTGVVTTSEQYRKTNAIQVSEGDEISVTGIASARFWAFYNDDTLVSGNEYGTTRTVPTGANKVIISFATTDTTNIVVNRTYWGTKYANNAFETAYSTNILNVDAITWGKTINASGTIGNDANYGYTELISVEEKQCIVIGHGINTLDAFRFLTAYDADKNVVESAGRSDQFNHYTVPTGIKYIRLTVFASKLYDDTRVNTGGILLDYEPFATEEKVKGVDALEKKTNTILTYPLTELPEYVLNNLAYKPLGSLSKPYICFVSDDGDAELATYTLPMFMSKNVPLTCAVMSTSEVFATTEGTNIVVDAVLNHNCSIAQHGGVAFTSYDERQLNVFFDNEKEFFDTLGLEVRGAVCPEHKINKIVACVCGGRFGVLRSGYEGNDGSGNPSDLVKRLGYYCSGGRSNIYALSSGSTIDGDLNVQKEAIDYAIENNLLLVRHFHEYELTDERKAVLESMIDYAKERGITFINFGDIKHIV